MSFSFRSNLLSFSLLAIAGSAALMSTGCALNGGSSLSQSATSAVTAAGATSTSGKVHGGNQPVTGASIKLYAVGTPSSGSGYGVGSTAITLSTPITTDSNGFFNIPAGTYTCPTPTTQVYMVSSGGNPGLSGNNPNLALMAALGPCPAGGNLIATVPFVDINEVTTVAAVWSLQQFMAAPATGNSLAPSIGAPTTVYANSGTGLSVSSAVIGMTNAFTTANVLASVATGSTPNPTYAAYATPESAKINTLADILAPCVNSTGGTSGDNTTPCGLLFAAATPSGATPPTDTIQAAWYMAQNPINNIATLYGMVGSSPPFQPTITIAPGTTPTTVSSPATYGFNDTTIAINYAPFTTGTTYALSEPYWIAIDAYGNAWVDNTGGGGPVAGVVELGVDGSALLANTTGYTVSSSGGSISQYATYGGTAPSGTALNTTFSAPKQLAIDLGNNAWIANEAAVVTSGGVTTGSVAEFFGSTTSGLNGVGASATAPTGYFVGDNPWGIAVDANNNIWETNTATSSTTVIDGRSIGELTAANGTYTWSTNATTPAANTAGDPRAMPGGQALLAIDANASGPYVWASVNNTCKISGAIYGESSSPYGIIQLFNDTNGVTGLPLGETTYSGTAGASYSQVTTANSGAVPGSSSTNCGSSTPNIGQVFNGGSLSSPDGIAIDASNGAWIADSFANGSPFDGLTYIPALGTSGKVSGATISTSGGGTSSNVTATNANTGFLPVTLYNGTTGTSSVTPIHGTTLDIPSGIAIDGNGNAWTSDSDSTKLPFAVEATLCKNTTAYGCSGSGATATAPVIMLLTPGQGTPNSGEANGIGFTHNIGQSYSVAIDPSGNVWYTNQSSNSYANAAATTTKEYNSVTVVVGAAAPVVTPLSLALKNTHLGQKP